MQTNQTKYQPRNGAATFQYVSATQVMVHIPGHAPVTVTAARAAEILPANVLRAIPKDGTSASIPIWGGGPAALRELVEGQELLGQLQAGGRLNLFNL